MDKKITQLAAASAIDAADISVLVHNNTDHQYTFTTLLTFLGNNLQLGAGISFGTTLPQNTVGKNGDVYINTSAGSFAQKLNGAWMVVYTLPSTGNQADGTVLYGLGAPANATGNNNDTYINTANGIFYKKAAGVWSLVFTMQNGPAGVKGDKGDKGDAGISGRSILSGSANPSNTTDGTNGDYYINTGTYSLFGPKTGGVWGGGVSLVGPEGAKGDTGNVGPAGATGATGAGIAAGGTTGQVLKKQSADNFDTGWANEQDVSGKADITYVDVADATLLAMLGLKMDKSGGLFTGDVGIDGSLNADGHGITANNIDLTGYLNAESMALSGGITADNLGVRAATFTNPDGLAIDIPDEGYISFGRHSGNPWYMGNSSADGGLEISTSGEPAFIFKDGGVISRNTGGEVIWSNGESYLNDKVEITNAGPTTPALKVKNNADDAYVQVAGFFAPNNTTTGNSSQLDFGVSQSLNNCADWRFIYDGDSSILNRIDFGFSFVPDPVFTYLANNRLGIGTTSPAAMFAVGASSQFQVDESGNVTAGDISTPHIIIPDEDTGLTYKLNIKSGAINLVLA